MIKFHIKEVQLQSPSWDTFLTQVEFELNAIGETLPKGVRVTVKPSRDKVNVTFTDVRESVTLVHQFIYSWNIGKENSNDDSEPDSISLDDRDESSESSARTTEA